MKSFSIQTRGDFSLIDLTEGVARAARDLGIREGAVLIFVKHTTCGVFINEDEEGLKKDIKNLLERLVPKEGNYAHNRNSSDGNAHSHLRALLFGQSLTVPIKEGKLALGAWQRIFMFDFDNKPRTREIVVTKVGG